jgi:glutathione synthase/RimK-type ligase-like ATP-grasp enzyme
LALRSAHAVGAPLAGVDLIPRPDGSPTVIDVNSTPGFQALTSVARVDIARVIMQYLTA